MCALTRVCRKAYKCTEQWVLAGAVQISVKPHNVEYCVFGPTVQSNQ